MKNKIIILLLVTFLIPFKVNAATLNLFYGKECPHCEEERQYLDELKKQMGSNLTINKYEVWHNKENALLMQKVGKQLNVEARGVPYTVIGKTALIGFNDNTKSQITKLLKSKEANYDTIKDIKNGKIIKKEKSKNQKQIKVPLLGKISPTKVSLPLLAIILGFLDGVNPCAMWILLFLITMLMQNKKKRMLSLGFAFIITSGIVYTLFMVAWLNIALSAMQQVILRNLIGLIAIVTGIINLKSYIKAKNNPDGCEVVDDKKRKKILTKIKKFTKEKSFILALLGIITLAFTVNLIELACSAGLPLLFTSILALNDLNQIEYVLYIFIYILFFLIDDIIVFLIAVKTMEVTGLSTKYSKYSHLIGGIIMLLIGILLIFKTKWIMLNF